MKAKTKRLIFFVMFAVVLASFSGAEILVQTVQNNSSAGIDTDSKDIHKFIVNTIPAVKYQQVSLPKQAGNDPVKDDKKVISIMLSPIKTQAKAKVCEAANFSFMITNVGSTRKLYRLSLDDFVGTAYMTESVLLNPKAKKTVSLKLSPDCKVTGDTIPVVVVETQERDEEARLPLSLQITGSPVDKYDCKSVFNATECDSNRKLALAKGTAYKLDLSKWFYDPDGDNLEFSLKEPVNLIITLKNTTAEVKPKDGFIGTEAVIFTASDKKGGKAESKRFYFEVTDKEESFFDKLLKIFKF